MNGFNVLLKRELAMAWSRGGGPALALAFNIGAVTLLPLASGGSLDKLKDRVAFWLNVDTIHRPEDVICSQAEAGCQLVRRHLSFKSVIKIWTLTT